MPSSVMLKDVVKHYLAMAEFLLRESNADIGPVRAIHGTLVALKELYYLELAPQLDTPDWRAVRDRIAVGLVKETEEHGNTSVSMYLATKYFEKFSKERYVGLMNCGHGGVKYQLYQKKLNIISVVTPEFKPGQPDTGQEFVQLDKLECGTYQPNPGVTVTVMREQLLKERTGAPWNKAEYPDVAVYAFITGALRNHFENKEQENERDLIDEKLSTLFEGIAKPVGELIENFKFSSRSFLIAANVEGSLEINGARVMYAQMHAESKKLQPIASLGIGRESAQWAQYQGETFSFPGWGMNHPKVCELGIGIVHRYRDDPELFTAFRGLIEGCGQSEIPTIALKSGCLLVWANKRRAFDKEQRILSSIVKNSVSLYVESDAFSQTFKMNIPIGTTMTELCRQATTLFREKIPHTKVPQFVLARDVSVVTSDLEGQVVSLCTLDDGESFGVRMKKQDVSTLEDLCACVKGRWENQGDSPHLSSPSVPLAWSLDKWQLASDMQAESASSDQIFAFRGSWSLLQKLWMYNSTKWNSVKHKVQVGLMRSTRKYGNTSVAMGFAEKYLTASRTCSVVALVNCGSGGVKIQVYSSLPSKCGPSREFRIALVAESKPVAWRALGSVKFSNLKVDCQKVKPRFEFRGSGAGTSVAELRHALHELLRDVPWKTGSWPEKIKDVPTFAFITGRLRTHWESLPQEEAHALRQYVNQVFEPCQCAQCFPPPPPPPIVPPPMDDEDDVKRAPVRMHIPENIAHNGGDLNMCICSCCTTPSELRLPFVVRPISDFFPDEKANFFLQSKVESHIEFAGVSRFYSQMSRGNAVGVVSKVVGVLSIEKSCSRFTMLDNNSLPHETKYIVSDEMLNEKKNKLPGMDESKYLLKLGDYIMRVLLEKEGALMNNLMSVIQKSIDQGELPLIALKGGCSLLLEGKNASNLCRELTAKPPLSPDLEHVHVQYIKAGRTVTYLDSMFADHTDSSPIFVQIASLECSSMRGIVSHIRFPITYARFCAWAHEWLRKLAIAENMLDKFPSEFLFIYVGPERSTREERKGENSDDESVNEAVRELTNLQLVPLRGTRLTANDVNGRCLYFSSDKHPTRLDAMLPDLAQLVGRGKYIYHERQSLLGDARLFFERQLSDATKAPQVPENQLEAYVAAAEVEAVLSLTQRIQFDAVHFADCAPPLPCHVAPVYPRALESFIQNLPLGMYAFCLDKGPGTLAAALTEQLHALGIRNARDGQRFYSENIDTDFFSLSELMSHPDLDQFRLYILPVCQNRFEFKPPMIYGTGPISMVILQKSDTTFLPVWSSRPPDEHNLWTLLRPHLGQNISPIQDLRVFGNNWAEIVGFKLYLGDLQLLTQVRRRLNEMVMCHLQPADEVQTGYGLNVIWATEERPWFSVDQWSILMDDLNEALAYGTNPDYKREVGLAFHLALKDRWSVSSYSNSGYISPEVEAQLEQLYIILLIALGPDALHQIASQPILFSLVQLRAKLGT